MLATTEANRSATWGSRSLSHASCRASWAVAARWSVRSDQGPIRRRSRGQSDNARRPRNQASLDHLEVSRYLRPGALGCPDPKMARIDQSEVGLVQRVGRVGFDQSGVAQPPGGDQLGGFGSVDLAYRGRQRRGGVGGQRSDRVFLIGNGQDGAQLLHGWSDFHLRSGAVAAGGSTSLTTVAFSSHSRPGQPESQRGERRPVRRRTPRSRPGPR